MRKKKSLFGAILCICTLLAVLMGCPTEPEPEDKTPSGPQPDDPGYSLGLSQDEVSVHVMLGSYYSGPGPVNVTVTNTGTKPTENLYLTIKDDTYNMFNLSTDEMPSLAVGATGDFEVFLPQTNPGHHASYAIEVEIGNDHVTKTFKLNYGTGYVEVTELTDVPGFMRVGRTISPGAADKDPAAAWFSSDTRIAVPNNDGGFTLTGAGTTTIGYVASTEPFMVKGMSINVFGLQAPYIVGAQIEDTSRDKVKVTFSAPVESLDVSKIKALVTVMPVGSAFPYENGTVVEEREMTAASGSGDVWTLTMEKSAAYGEILRVTTEEGAAFDAEDTALPAINQFIVRSLVKRTRAAFETANGAGGFYIDGVKDESVVNGPTLLKSAISAINGKGADEKLAKTWTVVLDQDQTGFNPGGTFSGGSAGQYLGSTLIVTTNGNTDINVHWANNGGVFTARNGMTIIVDEHIVFTGIDADDIQLNNNNHFMMAMDQGKIILDGCEFRNNIANMGNDSAGALRIGGGSNGAIVLINNAKIIGNTSNNSSGNMGYGGAITISDRGMLVMHGGEISGNTAKGTSTQPRAGAIATRLVASAQQPIAIYITGGVIKDNAAEGVSGNAAAGNLLIGASFQKTRGAIIKGGTVAETLTGVKSSNTAFVTGTGGWLANPDPTSVILYNGPASATDDVLSNTVLSTDPLVATSWKISDWMPPKEDTEGAYPWDR